MSTQVYDTNEAWKQAFEQGGYEHHCCSWKEIKKIKRLGRVWKKILHLTQIQPSAHLFELGSGGGRYLVQLALNGFETHGIDISEIAVANTQNYFREVNQFQRISTTVEVANIMDYSSAKLYDMCFHVGVLEHFLEASERQQIWKNMYELTRPGGWIVSVVPCGQHFMRKMIREQGLAGYNIPEIDYSCDLHRYEFQNLGLESIDVVPHNYFAFLSAHPIPFVSKVIFPFLFIVGNVCMPYLPVSVKVKERCAHVLIAIGRKPLE